MIFASDLSGFFNSTPVQIIFTIAILVAIQLILRDSIGRIVERVVRGHKYSSLTEERKREDTLTKIFRTASAVIIWTVGAVIVLSEFHINIAALMTGAGVVGVVVGLGAQSAIKDFLAGIFVIVENQYRVGDVVSFSAAGASVSGVVEDITIRITRLRDMDGNTHIVPNGSAGIVSNLSFGFANVNIDINLSYDVDVDKVERIINELGTQMTTEEPWKENIIDPIKFLRIDSFNDSAMVVKAFGKVKPGTQWDTAGAFRRRLKTAFEKNHIDIQLPQIVVHERKK